MLFYVDKILCSCYTISIERMVGHVEGSNMTNDVYTDVSTDFMRQEINKISQAVELPYKYKNSEVLKPRFSFIGADEGTRTPTPKYWFLRP